MSRVPAGWHRTSLSDVAHIQTGIAKGGKSPVHPIEVPYLRVANVQDGFLDLGEIKTIQIERSQIDRFLLQTGDVLLTEGGDFDKLGRGTVWRGELPNCIHQNHIFAVRLDNQQVLPEFFAAQAASPYGRQYFLSCAKRTTNLASVNKTQLSEFPVLLPPLPEQRKIAQILRTWDEAIATAEQLIAALQRRKKGLMQRLLTGQVRFPEFAEQPWESQRIGRLLKQVSRPVEWNDDNIYDLLSIRRRSEGIFVRSRRKGTEISTKQMNEAHEGDFLISKMQVVHGASALATKEFHRKHVSNSYIALVARDASRFDIRFFDWLSRTPDLYRIAYVSSHGVHIEKMSFDLSDYLDHVVRVPPSRAEQGRIVEVLEAAQEEIRLSRDYCKMLIKQKKGLMQRLLTGQVRVQLDEELHP